MNESVWSSDSKFHCECEITMEGWEEKRKWKCLEENELIRKKIWRPEFYRLFFGLSEKQQETPQLEAVQITPTMVDLFFLLFSFFTSHINTGNCYCFYTSFKTELGKVFGAGEMVPCIKHLSYKCEDRRLEPTAHV